MYNVESSQGVTDLMFQVFVRNCFILFSLVVEGVESCERYLACLL